MLNIRQALLDDAVHLAPKLRIADKQEIQAATGEEPFVALKRSIYSSHPCYAVVDEFDCVIALFGVIPDINNADVGSIWLLGSCALTAYPLYFLKHCKHWVDKLQEDYSILWNYIDARNEVHIRWLKWCGFTILNLVEDYGVEKRPFYEFERLRNENL
jgi:hypothetical protein